MATSRKSRGAKGIAVDFSDTESSVTLPEGDYLLKVEDVETKISENSGSEYLAITFVVEDGKFKNKKVWHNCSLQPQALFNLRGVLEALGFEVPAGIMELDPADMIGEVCAGAVAHEVYEGKKKARIVEFFSPEDLNEVEEEEVEEKAAPVVKKGKRAAPDKKAAPESEEGDGAEEAELPTYEEVQEAEKDDLIEIAEEHDIKLTLKQKKSVDTLREVICAALGLEAEEETKPVTKKKAKKSKALAEGSKVSFIDDEGEVLKGVITSIEGDDVTVEADDEEWELSLEDLTAV